MNLISISAACLEDWKVNLAPVIKLFSPKCKSTQRERLNYFFNFSPIFKAYEFLKDLYANGWLMVSKTIFFLSFEFPWVAPSSWKCESQKRAQWLYQWWTKCFDCFNVSTVYFFSFSSMDQYKAKPQLDTKISQKRSSLSCYAIFWITVF